MLDLLITDGTIVSPEGEFRADLGIRDGVISEMGNLKGRSARRTLAVVDMYVMPGLIDPHLHLAHPFREHRSTDDFYTGTLAAVAGGNTTVVDFAIQWSGTPREAVQVRLREARDAVIDYGLHPCLTRPDPDHIAEMRTLARQGMPSFKAYMVYRSQGRLMDDGGLLAMLEQTASFGGITGVHAENEDIADYRARVLERAGKTSARYFPEHKPGFVEAEAINRVLYLNELAGARLYIFHLSTAEGLRMIGEARGRGQLVWAETCTHYLSLSEDVYSQARGADFICSPPLRPHSDVQAMWEGVASGRICIVSSDHCGFSREQKTAHGDRFTDVPNGLPGVETRLPVVYTLGVEKGRIPVNRLVEVLSTNPARLFGLYPQKGAIAPGSDADLTVIDPTERRVICGSRLKTPAGWSPHEGLDAAGWPRYVISHGEILLDGGSIDADRGRGHFLRRRLPD